MNYLFRAVLTAVLTAALAAALAAALTAVLAAVLKVVPEGDASGVCSCRASSYNLFNFRLITYWILRRILTSIVPR